MKSIFYFLILAIFLGCSSDEGTVLRETSLIDKLASEIYEIVASAECSEDTGCDYIAFGSKPCGGPWGYLVYSTSVDVQLLKYKVGLYNQLQRELNRRSGAVSDCAVETPPSSLICDDGTCRAAD